MRHIGRSAAHVKTNHAAVTRHFGSSGHAHNTTRRATQNGIFAGKGMGIGQPARRLHEHQFDARHFFCHLVDISLQNGREVCIDDCGVASTDKLHQRAGLMGCADLGEPNVLRYLSSQNFMLVIAIGMHENNGHTAQTQIKLPLQIAAKLLQIQSLNHIAVGRESLISFNHSGI